MEQRVFQQEAERGLALVEGFFDEVFAILRDWAREVEADLARQLAAGPLSDGQLVALVEERSKAILGQTDVPIYGAGFCAAETVLPQGNPLAWWQGPDKQPLASSTFGVGPGAVDLRRLEWYRTPEMTGRAVVAGPFVDYLCSNQVTLTSAIPVSVDGAFAGVLCVDVLVSTLEDSFLPKLQSNNRVTVMNTNRRVVISTDVAVFTGDRLALDRVEHPSAGFASAAEHPFTVLSEPALAVAV